MQYSGIDIARFAQLNGNIEVNHKTVTVSEIKLAFEEMPHDVQQ